MLQRRFVDGCFDPALQQFLRLHALTDDFETTVGKARQYMDAQEQAVGQKPNIRFAANNPEPNQIQPIWTGRKRSFKPFWKIKIPGLRLRRESLQILD